MGFRVYHEDTFLDGDVHFIVDGLRDEYLKKVLCYPSCSDNIIAERITRLLEDGFVYILETGSMIHGIRVLGKGYSSVTTVAFHRKHGIGALKIRRMDSRRSDLSREAEAMLKAEPSTVVPRLYLYSKDYLFRELVDPVKCLPVERILEESITSGDIEAVKNTLHSILTSLYKLDLTRVDHTELNRPEGHLYMCPGGVKIIDWESARISEKPANLTSFSSFILYRFRFKDILLKALDIDVGRVLELLREYKSSYSSSVFNSILKAMSVV